MGTKNSQLSVFRFASSVALAWSLYCLVPVASHAAEMRPYRAVVTSKGLARFIDSNHDYKPGHSPAFEPIPVISLRGRAHRLGRFDVALTTRRNLHNGVGHRVDEQLAAQRSQPILLQGTVVLGGGLKRLGSSRVAPSAASIMKNELVVNFIARSKRGPRHDRSYSMKVSLQQAPKIVARIHGRALAKQGIGGCHALNEDVEGVAPRQVRASRGEFDSGSSQETTPVRVISISTDADPEWYARYGSESSAQIAKIINTAEALYFRAIGIGFSIHSQHVYTDVSPYTSSNAGELLLQFVTNPENYRNLGQSPELYADDVDAKHLFTGKDLAGSSVGVAYVGSICRYPALAFGLSQLVYDLAAPAVFAHELAHNLGAYHDDRNHGTLMNSALSIVEGLRFSAKSKGEIDEYLNGNSGCLDAENRPTIPALPPTDTPVPSDPGGALPGNQQGDSFGGDETLSLTVSILTQRVVANQRVVTLRGTLLDSAGNGVAERSVQLFQNNRRVDAKITNRRGRVVFLVRRGLNRGARQAFALKLQGSETTSSPVRF